MMTMKHEILSSFHIIFSLGEFHHLATHWMKFILESFCVNFKISIHKITPTSTFSFRDSEIALIAPELSIIAP